MANPLKLLKLKADGFQFIHGLPIDAPPKKVWASLLKVDRWFGMEADRKRGLKATLEAWPGGRWIIKSHDGVERLFGLVTQIEPGKLLRLSGTMGLSHLPANNVLIFELQPRDDGKSTLLRFGQRTFGLLTADVKKNVPNAWKQMLPNLKALAEKR
jgi:uncharacterized protein YndB with AHSA1/START domain